MYQGVGSGCVKAWAGGMPKGSVGLKNFYMPGSQSTKGGLVSSEA